MELFFPADYDQLVRRMVVYDELFAQFANYYRQDSGGDPTNKYSTLCQILTTTNLDTTKCDKNLGLGREKQLCAFIYK